MIGRELPRCGCIRFSFRSVPFRSATTVPFRSARNQRWRRGSQCVSVQVCFSPLSPCKNGHPDTTRNPSGIHLRMKISVSSIDRCPPFRAKRTDKAGQNLRPKIDRRFSRQSSPLARLVQDDGSRKLPQIISFLIERCNGQSESCSFICTAHASFLFQVPYKAIVILRSMQDLKM